MSSPLFDKISKLRDTNLSSTISAGDILYGNGGKYAALAGNGTATTKVLRMVAGAPTWVDFAAANLNDAVTLPLLTADNSFSGSNTFTKAITVDRGGSGTTTYNLLTLHGGSANNLTRLVVDSINGGGTGNRVDISALSGVTGRQVRILYGLTVNDSTGDLISTSSNGVTVAASAAAGNITIRGGSTGKVDLGGVTSTASSGTFQPVQIAPAFTQTGTAGARALLIAPAVNSLGSSTSSAAMWIEASGTNAPSLRPLVIRGAASQSANLTEWQDSSASLLASVTPGGNFIAPAFTASSSITSPLLRGTTTNTNLTVQSRDFTNAGTMISMATGTFSNSTGSAIAVGITPTYNQTGTAESTDLKIVRTETALGSGTHRLIDCYAGASGTTAIWSLGNDGHARWSTDAGIIRSSANALKVTNGSSGYGDLYSRTYYVNSGVDGMWGNGTGPRLKSTNQFEWSSTTNATASADTGLARSAAGVVKVTNGSTGYGHLSCNFLRTEGLNAGGTVSSGPDGVLQIQDNAGNTRYIPYYNTATLA